MKERLKKHIDLLFADAPDTSETAEVKEELLINLMEHYNDLVESGKEEEQAYAIVVSNIGDVKELIRNLKGEPSKANTESSKYEVHTENTEQNTYKEYSRHETEEEKSWSIGSMIDDFINNISSAFDLDCPVVRDKSYGSEGIHTVNLSFVSDTLRFYIHDKEEFRIVEYMSKNPTPDQLAEVDVYNGELNVKNGKRIFFIAKSKVDVYLPRNYHGNLNIKVTSSSIKTDELLNLKDVNINGVSCSLKAKGILCENLNVQVTSGSIKLEQLTGQNYLSTISGSIQIGSLTGGGEYKSKSGSVNLTFQKIESDVKVSAISGSIRLCMPPTESFYYEASAVSGNIHTCFNTSQYSSSKHSMQGSVGEEPAHKVIANAVSGGIWIQNN